MRVKDETMREQIFKLSSHAQMYVACEFLAVSSNQSFYFSTKISNIFLEIRSYRGGNRIDSSEQLGERIDVELERKHEREHVRDERQMRSFSLLSRLLASSRKPRPAAHNR